MRVATFAVALCAVFSGAREVTGDVGALRGHRQLTNPTASNAAAAIRSRSPADTDSSDNTILMHGVVIKLSQAVANKRYTQARGAAVYLTQLLDEVLGNHPREGTGRTGGVERSQDPAVSACFHRRQP